MKIIQKFFAVYLSLLLLILPLTNSFVRADETVEASPVPTNEVQATETNTTQVTNDNTATIDNSVTTDSNTGSNTIIPDQVCNPECPAQNTDTPVDSQPDNFLFGEVTPTPEPTVIPSISPEEATSEEAVQNSSESGATALNLDTPEDSTNSAEALATSSAEISNVNDATVDNSLTQEAQTGNNQTQGNAGTTQTGNASSQANMVNAVNTNLTGENFVYTLINLLSNTTGDINLSDIQINQSLDPSVVNALAMNNGTGDGSVNIALAQILSQIAIYNANNATLTNNALVTANTGDNESTGSASTISTGNALAQLNLFNLINTNLTGSNWFFGTINLFNSLTGNIILPYEMQYILTSSGPNSSLLTLNSNNGEGSTNLATASSALNLAVSNDNQATVSNTLAVGANSGKNTINGSGSITTGGATATANVSNIVNTNITGSRWIMLVIQNFGLWNGNLVGWWGNTVNIGNMTIAWVQLPPDPSDPSQMTTAINSQNGEGSTNQALASSVNSTSVTNVNNATVDNNISVLANTGENTVNGSLGTITTGNAQAGANVVNMVNTNIFGNNWYIGFVNIFNSFFGDIIFPRPDLSVSKSADRQNVRTGDLVTYTISYENKGKVSAKNVQITDVLPSGVAFVSASDGGLFSGNSVVWNVGIVPVGSVGSQTVTVLVSIIPPGDGLTNYVSISTTMDEPQKSNNTASSTVNAVDMAIGGTNTSDGNGSGTCSDTAPATAPKLITVIPGENSATLTWEKAKDPVSYYLVAYGTKPGVWEYGNPNIGGPDTTSYTVNNLSGGTTYYFVIRAGNGCMPGPFSNELSNVPSGFAFQTVTGNVMGIGTEKVIAAEKNTTDPENVTIPAKAACPWWLILSMGQIIGLGVVYFIWGDARPKKWWIFPIVLAFASFAGDHFIAHRFFAATRWCDFMWLWSAVGSIVPSAIYNILV